MEFSEYQELFQILELKYAFGEYMRTTIDMNKIIEETVSFTNVEQNSDFSIEILQNDVDVDSNFSLTNT